MGSIKMRYLSTFSPLGHGHASLRHYRKAWSMLASTSLLLCCEAAHAAPNTGENDVDDSWDIYAGDQLTYDDNLYRLPSGPISVGNLLSLGATPQDHINTTSAGADVHWVFGRQSIDLNAVADQNRFSRNDDLNNSAGNGKAVWNWRVGGYFSGTAAIDYSSSLAGFGYTGFLGRDLIDKTDYVGTAHYQIGPRWSVFGGVTESDITHSANPEQVFDYHVKSGDAGIEYATAVNNTIGLQYQYSNARYPRGVLFNGMPFAQGYDDESTQLLVKYALSEKTLISANGGYLKRTYPDASIGSFSGDVWKATVQWQPKDKTLVLLTAYRQLQAYLEAQSNYFVDTGGSLAPVWAPTEKLHLSFTLSWDDEIFIPSSLNALDLALRHDKVSSQTASVVYNPIRAFSFNLSYRHERRESNDPFFQYIDKTAAVGFTIKWGHYPPAL
jgi:exopolysaccharide biosynthesis operon protein EpsL